MWNDESPVVSKRIKENTTTADAVHTDASSADGHSKGVLAYSENGGFLLSHSIPRFPSDPYTQYSYKYPPSGKTNAQLATCVSSKQDDNFFEEMKILLDMMITFKPQVYASHVFISWPVQVRNKCENLIYPGNQNLGKPLHYYATYGQNLIKIHSFSRSDSKSYVDCFQTLANLYQTSIYAQAWPDKLRPLDSNCDPPFTVENINAIKVGQWGKWSQSKDHAKWIVPKITPSSSSYFICGEI
ncbi:deoxyribonuclease-2-beta-like [Belonocnema kinseyi]|uniref:deoxyribonuclease-2-beta-like n=1 Tax=Belonocnema kinseyi TaxID=2817044 RepID=UPI00143D9A48|nr:deoxyribonuclease-2-beta-like [Belonocnema kinseyi]